MNQFHKDEKGQDSVTFSQPSSSNRHLREVRLSDHPAGDDGPVPDPREELPRVSVEQEHERQVRLLADGDVHSRPYLDNNFR